MWQDRNYRFKGSVSIAHHISSHKRPESFTPGGRAHWLQMFEVSPGKDNFVDSLDTFAQLHGCSGIYTFASERKDEIFEPEKVRPLGLLCHVLDGIVLNRNRDFLIHRTYDTPIKWPNFNILLQVYYFLYAWLHALLLSDRENAWNDFCAVLVVVVRPHTCFFFGRWQRHAVSETFSAKAALSQELFDGTLLEQQCHWGPCSYSCFFSRKDNSCLFLGPQMKMRFSIVDIPDLPDCWLHLRHICWLHWSSFPPSEWVLFEAESIHLLKWVLIHSLKESICRCPQYGHWDGFVFRRQVF